MNCAKVFLFGVVILAAVQAAGSAEDSQPRLSEHLRPLEPFLGTWKGEFADSTAQKPLFDVMRMERALNGKAVRILHSINDGVYGGETLVMWDAEKKQHAHWYFTTAGFITRGTMDFQDRQWTSHEYVTGNAGGITEVKATGRLLDDGRLHVKSQYLRNGRWEPGHEVHYRRAPQAKVVFK